jgi:hypothetical protein
MLAFTKILIEPEGASRVSAGMISRDVSAFVRVVVDASGTMAA